MKRFFSIMLCLLFVIGSFPTQINAEDDENDGIIDVNNSEESESSETEPEDPVSDDEIIFNDDNLEAEETIETVEEYKDDLDDEFEAEIQNEELSEDFYNITVQEEDEFYENTPLLRAAGTNDTTTIKSSGTCGNACTWTIDNKGVLTVSGSGEMDDYDKYGIGGYNISVVKVVVESGITSIGEYAFSYKPLLKNVEIANTVKKINKYAFYSDSSLTSISLPNSVVSISDGVFFNCTSLETVELPSNITELQKGLFARCTSLESVVIPNSVTKINPYVFQDTAIKTLRIGKNVETIEPLSFFQTNISGFEVEAGNKYFSVDSEGVLYNFDKTKLVAYPNGNSKTSYTMPNTVVTADSSPFAGNTTLTTINLSKNMTDIPRELFYRCNGLKNYSIPDHIKTMGEFAFSECENLESVTLGKNLKETGYRSFASCKNLKNIDFGGLEIIGSQTFVKCPALESINIPSTVKEIGFQAFGDCAALSNVTLHEGLETVGSKAFVPNTKITSLIVPKSVTFVGANCVYPEVNLVLQNPKLLLADDGSYKELLTVKLSVYYDYDSAFKVLELVNQERAKVGAEPLVMEARLLEAAMLRGTEISQYFDHTRPSGYGWSTTISDPTLNGENIAEYQTNAESVMHSWMHSEGHKNNILRTSFNSIGIGSVKVGNTYYWVQLFSSTDFDANCAKPSNKDTINVIKYDPNVVKVKPFRDVPTDEYYYEPVLWALNNDITTGVNATTFAPNNNCTRGQVVTFLWRAAGSPEPKTTTNPFRDVKTTSTFYKAILWAYENNITTGVTPTRFDENGKCTRGQIVTFLWRYAGKPGYTISNNFADVPNNSTFKDAILWASENGITTGTGKNFYINRTCTRAQTVTFLYRYMNSKN